MSRSVYLLAVVASVIALSSCSEHLVRVQAYERGNLANPLMNDEHDPLRKPMSEHVYFSREASFGGGGVGGGGCGCN